ncbi:ACP S-malonyltransferase [Vagococcus sp. DIV0080]|uniref:Malonyl CoA-acyl carrier protein transacylase n=1 Tax=Candidatus Vagococcus giribetii TaxID=2230876 RepID=A0ABS3HR30_9ENTE|nr:ACP S-malonyltransferase [Vagococcus sp. DIV0080]MBO0475790.1 ACP S-malonyltransferase [Vagococcus sp. DIV0080]
MKIGFVFSGQGAQYLGMGHEFYTNSLIFKQFIDLASEVLDFDLPHLLFEENEKLNQTEYTQPAILAMSVAISEMIKEKLNITPSMCAGLSLGEYTALVESGALDFETALKLVRKRGKLMQEAVPTGVGAMLAVMGMERDVIQKVCVEASEVAGVYPANYNMPGQIVIGGYKEGVAKAQELLNEAGAKRLIPLNVSGPFHTPLLKEASDNLEKVLETITFNEMSIPVVTNVTGEVISDREAIRSTLTKQVMSPVYFEDCIRTMISSGVDTFIEIGPGKTLSSFIKKNDRTVKVQHCEDLKTFEKLELLVSGK